VLDVLQLYIWAFPFVGLQAAVLAFCGSHLAARERTLQSLSISQGAELGSIVFMFFIILMHRNLQEINSWMTLPAAVGLAFLMGSIAGKCESIPASSRATALFVLWISLFSISQIIVAMHPALESHFSKVAIGDVATLTQDECMVLSFLMLGFSVLLFTKRIDFLRASFSISLMGEQRALHEKSTSVLLLLIPAVSTWSTGFAMTCASLFVPTTLHVLYQRKGGARAHVKRCVWVGMLSAPLGLFLSLSFFPSLPTTPVMTLTLFCVSLLSAKFF
jgi:ABC-type Mn2+/Zn2+ transport system permease subunit